MAKKKDSLNAILYGAGTNGKLFTGELELLGTWEVAAYLGIEKSRIARWLKELADGETPIAAPVARLKCGPVWTKEQVQEKLETMYAEAHYPYGKSAGDLQRWVSDRRARRQVAA
jgi:hypothetical protein